MVDECALAMVSGLKQTHLEGIFIVLLDPKELKWGWRKKFEIAQENATTLVKDFENAHWNILNLTYTKLGSIIKIILKKFRENKVKSRSRRELTDLVIKALIQKRLEYGSLNVKVQKIVIKQCEALGIDTDLFIK